MQVCKICDEDWRVFWVWESWVVWMDFTDTLLASRIWLIVVGTADNIWTSLFLACISNWLLAGSSDDNYVQGSPGGEVG